MPGLGASFGRGAATTFQQDLANSDCILIMGSNMAEAHPVGFRWPMKAKEKGATLIHVDPRFTRTSALCDLFVNIRAGSDVAFLGGLVNYVLSNDRWFKEYVQSYTNAATIIQDGFRDTEDLEGLFSGYHGDGETGKYDAVEGHWGYECRVGGDPAASRQPPRAKMLKGEHGIQGHDLESGTACHSAPRKDMTAAPDGAPPHDPTLQHPRCVFQILKRHFARYTPEVVSQVCGCTPGELVRVAELLCANSGRERTSIWQTSSREVVESEGYIRCPRVAAAYI